MKVMKTAIKKLSKLHKSYEKKLELSGQKNQNFRSTHHEIKHKKRPGRHKKSLNKAEKRQKKKRRL